MLNYPLCARFYELFVLLQLTAFLSFLKVKQLLPTSCHSYIPCASTNSNIQTCTGVAVGSQPAKENRRKYIKVADGRTARRHTAEFGCSKSCWHAASRLNTNRRNTPSRRYDCTRCAANGWSVNVAGRRNANRRNMIQLYQMCSQ